MHTYMHAYIRTHTLHTLIACIHTLHAYTHFYISTCIRMQTCIHIYTYTYAGTCMHTYLCTDVRICIHTKYIRVTGLPGLVSEQATPDPAHTNMVCSYKRVTQYTMILIVGTHNKVPYFREASEYIQVLRGGGRKEALSRDPLALLRL